MGGPGWRQWSKRQGYRNTGEVTILPNISYRHQLNASKWVLNNPNSENEFERLTKKYVTFYLFCPIFRILLLNYEETFCEQYCKTGNIGACFIFAFFIIVFFIPQTAKV